MDNRDLEIKFLKEQLQNLKDELELLKAVVRSNYKESHPGVIFMDEYMKMRKNVNDIKSGD